VTRVRRIGRIAWLLLFVCSIAFAGCSSSGGGSKDESVVGNESGTKEVQQDSGDQGAGGQTTITVWHNYTGSDAEATEAVTKAFEDQNPDIKVELMYVPGGIADNKKLAAAIAGGTVPDVSFFDRFKISQFAHQGALVDLTDMANRDGINKDDFYADGWNEAVYKDKLYGLPVSSDTRMLFYNKDLFIKAGLDPDKPPQTIEELSEAADKLMIKEGNRFTQIGLVPWYSEGDLFLWGSNFGGDMFDEEAGKLTANTPEFVNALQWQVDFAKKYGVEMFSSFSDFETGAAQEPFVAGKLAMLVSGNWQVSAIQKYNPNLNYGITPMPNVTGDDPKSMLGGWSLVIPKGAKHEDAAWKYISFFGGAEGQRIYAKISGQLSPLRSVNEELYSNDPIMNQFVKTLEYSLARPKTTQGQLFRNGQRNAVDQAIHGNGAPQELLDKYTNEFNEALAKDQ
jgi:multiple sugar transport system substrate-binding protein